MSDISVYFNNCGNSHSVSCIKNGGAGVISSGTALV